MPPPLTPRACPHVACNQDAEIADLHSACEALQRDVGEREERLTRVDEATSLGNAQLEGLLLEKSEGERRWLSSIPPQPLQPPRYAYPRPLIPRSATCA